MANRKGFRGLNNVVDTRQLDDVTWLDQADNVDVTSRGALVRATGFVKKATNFAITGAYATKDLQRLYVVDAGELRCMNADMTYTVLKTGLSSAQMYFEEVNGQVFYANGIDFGVIDNVSAQGWGIPAPDAPQASVGSGVLKAGVYGIVCTFTDARGIESGNSGVVVAEVPDNSQIMVTSIPQVAGLTTNVYVTMVNGTEYFLLATGAGDTLSYNCGPDELGMELPFWHKDAPRGSMPAFFLGRMYLAEPMVEQDQTVIWTSDPLDFHHFDFGSNGLVVPGIVRMLRATRDALFIGTDRQVLAFDGDKLVPLAAYGVIEGWHASEFEGQLYFWTKRGLCRALPFENLTQDTISVAPGQRAGAVVMERDGQRRYIVSMQKGGEAYNPRV